MTICTPTDIFNCGLPIASDITEQEESGGFRTFGDVTVTIRETVLFVQLRIFPKIS